MDNLFYYYATYLAARFAGMPSASAQLLAYNCRSMADFIEGNACRTPWLTQKGPFQPILVSDKPLTQCNREKVNLGRLNSQLAFVNLPALIDKSVTRQQFDCNDQVFVEPRVKSQYQSQSQSFKHHKNFDLNSSISSNQNPSKNKSRQHTVNPLQSSANLNRYFQSPNKQSPNTQQSNKQQSNSQQLSAQVRKTTSCHYNPLTDVDWRIGGGQFTSAFSQRLAARHSYHTNEESNIETQLDANSANTHSEIDSDLGSEIVPDPIAEINCVANSTFAVEMVNSKLRQLVGGLSNDKQGLATLGCTLFVYQNTWRFSTQSTNGAINEHDSQNTGGSFAHWLDCFYWTYRTIKCHLNQRTLNYQLIHCYPAAGTAKQTIDNLLFRLYSMQGSLLIKEAEWLNAIPVLLKLASSPIDEVFTQWQIGLRYRPNYLLEQALIQCKVHTSSDCVDDQLFKDSLFYKLNFAAQQHSVWLQQRLNLYGYPSICTEQALNLGY
ncbi:hypothetical protein C2869_14150 [Saccharobesus litoralis]|uniref:Uncharacterized protein n=1 Tax=Saccharobesus litoralis TaxID=2172099 RepID=A0A2S0VTH3_9ALTE|nr:hypothetical protein [Saccharobesus litoralis]AWB67511.1 hypothetical protein C2869_14150 [Saccharobesus litoralis]